MTDIASVLSILFVLLIAFYVCVHTALTISEVKSAEAGANVVPAAFRPRVSLAEHRKAIDYTGEVIQSDLVAALVGAGIALLLTFGGGFTICWPALRLCADRGLRHTSRLRFSLASYSHSSTFRYVGGRNSASTSATVLKRRLPSSGLSKRSRNCYWDGALWRPCWLPCWSSAKARPTTGGRLRCLQRRPGTSGAFLLRPRSSVFRLRPSLCVRDRSRIVSPSYSSSLNSTTPRFTPWLVPRAGATATRCSSSAAASRVW